jgi:hypothetical protein
MLRSRTHPCNLVYIFEFEGVCDRDSTSMFEAKRQQKSSIRVLLSNAMVTDYSFQATWFNLKLALKPPNMTNLSAVHRYAEYKLIQLLIENFLAHLSWKLKKVQVSLSDRLLSVVCLSVWRLFVRLLHFQLLLQNHWANFNQSWHKWSLGKGDSELYKWRITSFPMGR